MKILYFHQHFSTPAGAAGTRSYEMARKLTKRGHEVTMVCGSYSGAHTGVDGAYSKGKRSAKVDGISVVELELSYSNADSFLKRTLTFLKFAFSSVKVALTTDYDLIFATSTPLTASVPGMFAKVLRRKPFVFEVRDLWPTLPKEMGVISNPVILFLMGVLEWLSYHLADRVVALAPGIAEGVIQRGIKPDRVAMIPNGCDLELFDQNAKPLAVEGISDSDFVATFTGTHGIANGLDAVLDAAEVLEQQNVSDIKLLLVGQGALKPALQQRAQDQQLSNVIFLPSMSKEELGSVMSRANVGLQVLRNVPAFYYGTSPNKFFDYMAAGLPVLCNYPGWLTELIEQHQCGFAIPPESPAKFAEALVRASKEPAQLQQMGENARRLAEASFSRDSLSTAFADLLEETLAERHTRAAGN